MLKSHDGSVKIREFIVNNKRLKSMEIGRDAGLHLRQFNNIETPRSPCGYDSPTRGGLEEVLSNGTVPQSAISRPSFTGYSK